MVSYFINSLYAPKKVSKSKYNVTPIKTTMDLPTHIYSVILPSGEKAYYLLEAHPNRFTASFCKKCDRFLNSENDENHFSENNVTSCVRQKDHETCSPAYQVNCRNKMNPAEILENSLILIYPDLNDRNNCYYINTAKVKMDFLRSENRVVNFNLDQVREVSFSGNLKPVTEYQCSRFNKEGYTAV